MGWGGAWAATIWAGGHSRTPPGGDVFWIGIPVGFLGSSLGSCGCHCVLGVPIGFLDSPFGFWDPHGVLGVPIGFFGSPLGAWSPVGQTGVPKMLGTPYTPRNPPDPWNPHRTLSVPSGNPTSPLCPPGGLRGGLGVPKTPPPPPPTPCPPAPGRMRRTAACGRSTSTSARICSGSGSTNPKVIWPTSAWGRARTSGAPTRSTPRWGARGGRGVMEAWGGVVGTGRGPGCRGRHLWDTEWGHRGAL